MRHSLMVLSAEQLMNAPDDKPESMSPGASGNIWRRTKDKMGRKSRNYTLQ